MSFLLCSACPSSCPSTRCFTTCPLRELTSVVSPLCSACPSSCWDTGCITRGTTWHASYYPDFGIFSCLSRAVRALHHAGTSRAVRTLVKFNTWPLHSSSCSIPFSTQCVPFIMPEHWASGAICEDLPGYTIHSEASMRQVQEGCTGEGAGAQASRVLPFMRGCRQTCISSAPPPPTCRCPRRCCAAACACCPRCVLLLT